ncbi:molybdopterin-dependent oxidoreductase [Desulfonatronospira sp.]|uniref:molybdopterin-dependent oxidoreductase n=1 Tax=Desulfonatronospira sp. TaxID=1962951 RepID=UPI0025C1EAE0|nr:molybdopterin-dependent oxidoreductase [Desulfonatronospira sp.]
MKQMNIGGSEDHGGSTRISRRTFVKGAAVTGAGLAMGGPVLRALSTDTVHAAPGVMQGEWKSTFCTGCTTWCSLQAYVVNGRAIKMRGHPQSKTNGQYCCPRAHLALQQLYDPDRLKTPMKRTNPKKGRNEDPGFVPISWDEAMGTLADKIMELRDNREPHKFILFRGRYTAVNSMFYGSLPRIIGSPNNISHSSICAEAEKMRYFLDGIWGYMQYDMPRTRYVLIWGADPLVANRQVSSALRDWGDVLDNARICSIEPRLSGTGSKCDEWMPVKPGYDGALACAMAHVILTEGMWYKPFVGDFKDGVNRFRQGQTVDEDAFEEIHTHGLVKWWNITLKDATPEWAEDLCQVPADQIRRVAMGFADAAPRVMSWVGGGPGMQPRGSYASMAAYALNGLTGGIDNEGGVLTYNSTLYHGLPSHSDFIDSIAEEGNKYEKIDQRGRLEWPNLARGVSGAGVNTNNVADAILDEDPYLPRVGIGYFANFNFSCPGTQRWEKAMQKLEFFAHMTTHASEMSWYSDIVLPVKNCMYEQWATLNHSSHKHASAAISSPMVKSIWDARAMETEIPWLLAEKLAERGFDNLLNFYKTFKDPETGSEPSTPEELDLYSLKIRTRRFWDPSEYRGGDRFKNWEEFKNVGVWNSDEYEYRHRWSKMGTRTGKFEFYSETLKEALEKHAERHGVNVDRILEVCNYEARGEDAFVPHHENPYEWGDPGEYPFKFVDYKSRLNREGRSANCAWYNEMKDVDPGDIPYEDVAKLNPRDAERLGLKAGDRVRLTSPIGSIVCTLNTWEGVMPGTVAKCFGQGHWAYGRYASKVFGKEPHGANNNDIIPADYDRLSGSTAFYGHIRLKVEKV